MSILWYMKILGKWGPDMTDKELRKLRRHELRELLVAQSREAAECKTELSQKAEELSGVLESLERLKGKLNEKDESIERLKGRLDEKDALLEKLKKRLNEKDVLIEKLKAVKWKELEGSGVAADILMKLRTLL